MTTNHPLDVFQPSLQRQEIERMVEVLDDIIDLNDNALKNLDPEEIPSTEQDTLFLKNLKEQLLCTIANGPTDPFGTNNNLPIFLKKQAD